MLFINPLIKSESDVKHFIVKFRPEKFTDILFAKIFIFLSEKSKIFLQPSIFISLLPIISKLEFSLAKLSGELFKIFRKFFIFSLDK